MDKITNEQLRHKQVQNKTTRKVVKNVFKVHNATNLQALLRALNNTEEKKFSQWYLEGICYQTVI